MKGTYLFILSTFQKKVYVDRQKLCILIFLLCVHESHLSTKVKTTYEVGAKVSSRKCTLLGIWTPASQQNADKHI